MAQFELLARLLLAFIAPDHAHHARAGQPDDDRVQHRPAFRPRLGLQADAVRTSAGGRGFDAGQVSDMRLKGAVWSRRL